MLLALTQNNKQVAYFTPDANVNKIKEWIEHHLDMFQLCNLCTCEVFLIGDNTFEIFGQEDSIKLTLATIKPEF